eukprot:2864527-Prymnesium_polylepis.1
MSDSDLSPSTRSKQILFWTEPAPMAAAHSSRQSQDMTPPKPEQGISTDRVLVRHAPRKCQLQFDPAQPG